MPVAARRPRPTKKRVTPRRRRGPQRADNRRDELLSAAARLFSQNGFDATSMRDIANEVGMLAGSMYYHFPAKDDLIAAAHEEGVREIVAAMERAVEAVVEPWDRLEAACVAHLENLLGGSDIAGVVAIDFSQLGPALRERLIEQRDRYEIEFARLIDALELEPSVDRRLLRLSLLGSLNWTPSWYRPDGDEPGDIARHFVALVRRGVTAG